MHLYQKIILCIFITFLIFFDFKPSFSQVKASYKSYDSLDYLYLKGELNKEKQIVIERLKIARKVDGSPVSLIIPLINAGKVNVLLENFHQAKTYLHEAQSIMKNNTGWLYPDYATALNYLIYCKIRLKDFNGVEEMIDEVQEIHQLTIGKETKSYVNILFNEGFFAFYNKDYILAKKKLIQAQTLARLLTDEIEYYGKYIFIEITLNRIYINTLEDEKALSNLFKIKEKLEELKLDKTILYARTLIAIGDTYFSIEDFKNSHHYYQLYDKESDVLSKNNLSFKGDVLRRIANIYFATSEYKKSVTILNEALIIYQKLEGETTRLNEVILKLAYNYYKLGFYDKINPLIKNIQINKENSVDNYNLYILIRVQRRIAKGEYIRAELLLSELMDDRNEKYFSVIDHLVYQNKIQFFILFGRSDKASVLLYKWTNYLNLFQKENSIWSLEKDLLSAYLKLSNNSLESAITDLNNLEIIFEASHDEQLYNIFILHYLKGQYFQKKNKYKDAIHEYKIALGIANELNLKDDNIQILKIMVEKLWCEVRIKEYNKTEKRYLKLLNEIPQNHILYSRTQSDLAYYYSLNEKWSAAENTIQLAIKDRLKLYYKYFDYSSEIEKRLYLKKTKYIFDVYFEILSQHPSEKLTSLAYNIQLIFYQFYWKDAQNRNEKLYKYQEERQKFNYPSYLSRLNLMQSRIATFNFASPENKQKYQYKWLETVEQVNNLEKTLVLAAETFSNNRTQSTYAVNKWTDVQKKLKKNSVAIEIINVNTHNLASKPHYIALLITKEATSPIYIPIGEANLLEKEAYTLYLQHMRLSRSLLLTSNDEIDTYNIFWKPIKEKINALNYKPEKIYLCSDGIYRLINLNTLKNPVTEKYVIEEDFIVPLVSTSKLLEEQTISFTDKTALLIGNPAFGDNSDSHSYQNMFFRPYELPGTQNEVDEIENLLKSEQWDVTKITRENATEEYFKSISPSPEILHIATHGFFIQNDKYSLIDNPLFQSGLLLSDMGNGSFKHQYKLGIDGILTAYEVVNLNLTNTQLLILSACETGITDFLENEEVLGLQFSFNTAGVKTIVMSLWDVDDRVTQELMTFFYQDFIQETDKDKAFRNAQLKILDKYKGPYYWGAFKMVN